MQDRLYLYEPTVVECQSEEIAHDLLETLTAHKNSCVGIAANMIGVKKRIIAFLDESGRTPTYTMMLNLKIIKKDGAYNTEEGCLSLLSGKVEPDETKEQALARECQEELATTLSIVMYL